MNCFERVGAYTMLAVLILSSPACDSKDDDEGSSTNANSRRKDDAGASEAGHSVKWGLAVYDYEDPDMPVEGLKVCVYPALKPCEITDEAGHAALTVPADADAGVLIDGSQRDYIKLLVLFATTAEDTDENEFVLVTTGAATQLAEASGYTYDPKKGTVIGQALDAMWGGVDGVTTTLEPSAGFGPVYYGSEGPDKSLTSTSAGGGGRAVIGAVPPGDYTLTFSGKECSVGLNGWRGEEERVGRVPVLAGVRTLTAAQCE